MLWKQAPNLQALNAMPRNMATHLGIEFTACTEDSISARMPVDERTHQPMGILHGGASAVLAETLGSVASHLIIDTGKHAAVGLEINANHLRPVTSGYVTGICAPIHIGSKTHVWDIRIFNEKNKLVCISRLTVAIIPRPNY